jgi:hypothetical protein
MRLPTALLLLVSFIGCTPRASKDASGGRSSSSGTEAPATSSRPDVSPTLPSPKVKVSLQQKSVKAFPLKDGQSYYEVLDQWVFQPIDGDDSLICVGDDEHCIPLSKLKEQLYRPANDPLAIR